MLNYNNAHSSQNINIQMPTCGYLLSWFLIYNILHTTYLLIFIWARGLAFLIYFLPFTQFINNGLHIQHIQESGNWLISPEVLCLLLI